MNSKDDSKIEVISGTEFLGLLDGKWRFVRGEISPYTVIKDGMRSSIVGYGKKVGLIKKLLIIPVYFENKLDGHSPDKYFEILSNSMQEQALLEESDFLEDISVLLVGECCGIGKEAVERLRGLFSPINFVAAPYPQTEESIGLRGESLKEKSELIANGLRSHGLMEKQETIWH